MVKQMKISEVLHKAADTHLCHDSTSYRTPNKDRFSCYAIRLATEYDDELYGRIEEGLENMGCPTRAIFAFTRLGYDDDMDLETQGARYMWLKFAALMAEEQGV